MHVHFLFLERHFGQDSKRQIRNNIQQTLGVRKNQGCIVTGIAIFQMAVGKIQDSAEECNEHVVLIHLGHTLVHYRNYLAWTVLMRRHGTEQASGDSHYQRRRNTLAGNVSDAEDEFLIPDEEIVEVSTNFPCRNKGSTHVDVMPFREWREDLGDHGHLYVACDLELTLHPLLLFRQSLIPLLIPSYGTEDEHQHQQTKQMEQPGPPVYVPDAAEYFVLGDNDGHRPSRTLYRSMVDIVHLTLVTYRSISGFSRNQIVDQGIVVINVLIHGGHHFLDGLLHDEGLHRAHHDLSGLAAHDAECVRIDLHIPEHVGEPVQRNVGCQHCCDLPLIILYRHGECSHEHFAATFIDIRLGPVAGVAVQRLVKPFLGRIVIFRSSQGTEFQFSRDPVLVGVGCQQWEVVIVTRN